MIFTSKLFWACLATLFYTYVGYPMLLAMLARFRSKTPDYRPTRPEVTLLIAAYNEEAIIAEKLVNSLALNYPDDRLQILVAVDGSDDRTPDIVAEFAGQGVELSYNPLRRGKMAAMNQAVPKARGQIILFSDANNMYQPNVVQQLVAAFSDPTVGAVSGAKQIIRGDGTLGESEGLYWKYELFIKTQETRLGSCTGVAGEIFAIRKDLFEPPPDNIINDDFYMAMRLIKRGYRVVYSAEARSSERISVSAQDEVARRARIVAGRYQAMSQAAHLLPFRRPILVWQIISHKFMRPLVPLAMAGAFLTNVFALFWPTRSSNSIWQLTPPLSWALFMLQLVFYGLAWLGNLVALDGAIGKVLYLPTFLVNSNLAGLIGLYRFLTKSQTTLWKRAQRR